MKKLVTLILAVVVTLTAAVTFVSAEGNPCIYFDGRYANGGYSDITESYASSSEGATFIVDIKVTDAVTDGPADYSKRFGDEQLWSRVNLLTSTYGGDRYRYCTYNFGKGCFEIFGGGNWSYKDYDQNPDVYNLIASVEAEWTLGEWHEFAIKTNGSVAAIYFDGKKVVEGDWGADVTDLQSYFIVTSSYVNVYFDNMIVAEKDFDIVNKTGEIYYFDHDFLAENRDWNLGSDKYSLSPDGTDKVTYVEDGYAHEHVYREFETVDATVFEGGYTKNACIVCGNITKTNETEPLPAKIGDVNGDDEINTEDVIALMKHNADWDIKIVEKSADVTGDNKINTEDVILIMKYNAGWNVQFAVK